MSALVVQWNPTEKRRRRLSVLGALVVLVTFVTKEGAQDRTRGIVSSFHAAEELFILSNGTDPTSLEAINIEVQELILRERSKVESSEVAETQRAIALSLFQMSIVEGRYQNVVRLISQFPDKPPTYWKALEDFRLYELAKNRDEEDKLIIRMNTEIDSNGGAELRSVSTGLRSLAKIQVAATGLAGGSILGLGNEILGYMGEVRKEYERRLGMLTWAGYFLYSIGWGLSLLGIIMEADNPTPKSLDATNEH